jgi:hypothetical protein
MQETHNIRKRHSQSRKEIQNKSVIFGTVMGRSRGLK